MARRGALTVEVTVSSFSSYVAFLEGYARALMRGGNADGTARAPGCARRSARRAPRSATLRIRRSRRRRGSLSVSFPERAHRPRHLAARAGSVRAAGAARRRPQPQGRRGARRVSGDRRLQRRLGRARDARGRAASARGRLRVRRIGAEPDGADARAEAAVLQGRPGHAAREDSGRRIRRVHRRAVRAHRASGRSRGSARAIVDLAGNLPYDVQRLAHETWDEVRVGARTARHARRSASGAAAGCSPSSR